MSNQSSPGPTPAALEGRVQALEDRVTALTDAVRELARGLEDIPTLGSGPERAAAAARRAYDLLLIADGQKGHSRTGGA